VWLLVDEMGVVGREAIFGVIDHWVKAFRVGVCSGVCLGL